MFSYVIEFNLAQRGEEAQEFLAEAARTWPKLWGDIPGVTGTLLLSSAFALGGKFSYQLRVDLESLSTLARLDEVLKGDDPEWVRARNHWFRHRTTARAHLSEHVAGDEGYAAQKHRGSDGAVHLVLSTTERGGNQLEAANSVSGLVGSQTVRSLVGADVPHEQTWLRLQSLNDLDSVSAAGLNVGAGRLFGELREVDGSLFAGA
jgi:hypothetical protein